MRKIIDRCPNCKGRKLEYMETALRGFIVIEGVPVRRGSFKVADLSYYCPKCKKEGNIYHTSPSPEKEAEGLLAKEEKA